MSMSLSPMHSSSSVKNRLVLVFVAITLGVVTAYRLWPDSPLWLPAALAAIALAIWHGAYDAVLAENLWQPRFESRWMLPFFAAYVGLAFLVVGAWYVFPGEMLIAFLLYSGVHFGTEQEVGSDALQIASAAAFGCVPIAAACYWHGRMVISIFTTMLRGRADDAEHICGAVGLALLPLLLVALAGVVLQRTELLRRAVLLASQLVLFRFCSPVIAFAVFFCALHTPEHLIETSRTAAGVFSTRRMWRNLRQGILPWLISLAAVAIAAWMGRRTAQAYVGLLFIALSALTVPHMVLALIAAVKTHRGGKRQGEHSLPTLKGAAH